MKPRLFAAAALVLSLTALGLSRCEPVQGCAPAPPRNKHVEIAGESAIIIWDEESKTEHFIRRASFKADTNDFGFLVPTPTQPTLKDVPDDSFTTLETITAPRVITQPRPASSPGCGCGAMYPMAAGKAEQERAVRMLDEQRVGKYDAVVLEANDARALSDWLTDHGYEFSPALEEWVKPYLKAGWKITAFRIATDLPDATALGTSAVRMSFKTERPFYPYREPESKPVEPSDKHPARLLRVYFLSESKTKGTLGEIGKPWPGSVEWANKVPPADRDELLKALKLADMTPPAAWYLTEFEDHSAPRPGSADVYFSKSEDQNPVEREPHIHYVSAPGTGCVTCYALAALMSLSWCRRRRVRITPRVRYVMSLFGLPGLIGFGSRKSSALPMSSRGTERGSD